MSTNSIKLLTGNSYPELARLVADRYVQDFAPRCFPGLQLGVHIAANQPLLVCCRTSADQIYVSQQLQAIFIGRYCFCFARTKEIQHLDADETSSGSVANVVTDLE